MSRLFCESSENSIRIPRVICAPSNAISFIASKWCSLICGIRDGGFFSDFLNESMNINSISSMRSSAVNGNR